MFGRIASHVRTKPGRSLSPIALVARGRVASAHVAPMFARKNSFRYLTKVTRVMDDCEAKQISTLKITYQGDTKGLNDARGEMVKLVEPVRAALESKSPFLGASIPERVIFIDKVAASKDAEAEFTKVLEQHIMYARSRCLELAPSPP